jgi:uncharacterized protein involved in exopolysaccharide biosynthesis
MRYDEMPVGPPPRTPDTDPFGWGYLADLVGFALRAPRRHRVLAACSFVAVVLAALGALALVPFRYQVQATVLAQRTPLMGSLSNPGMNRDWDVPTRAAREVIIRRSNLVAVCERTRFVERYLETRGRAALLRERLRHALTGKDRTREQVLEDLVDTLAERLWVTSGAEGTVTITFEWTNREIAFDVVEAAVQAFMEERYTSEINAVAETIAVLESHDERLRRDIKDTVTQVEEKQRVLRIRTGGSRAAPSLPRGANLEDAARIRSVLAARRRAASDLESFREQRLAEMQTQLAQQEAIYAPAHPVLMSTRQAIEALSTPSPNVVALRGEIQQLEGELARLGATEDAATATASLQADVAAARQRLLESDDPRLEIERRRLEDLLHQHSSLMQRIDAARVEMDTARAAFKHRYTLVTPPQMPKRPIRPYVLIYAVIGVLGGIVAAIAASTLRDLWGGRVLERWQVERALEIPVVGEFRR